MYEKLLDGGRRTSFILKKNSERLKPHAPKIGHRDATKKTIKNEKYFYLSKSHSDERFHCVGF